MTYQELLVAYLTPPGRTITGWQAIKKWNCTRLAAIVFKVNKTKKHFIDSERVYDKKNKVSYSKYRMVW